MNCGLGVVAATLRFKPGLIHHQQKMEMGMNWMRPLSRPVAVPVSRRQRGLRHRLRRRWPLRLRHEPQHAVGCDAARTAALRRSVPQLRADCHDYRDGIFGDRYRHRRHGLCTWEKTADAAQRKAERMCRQRANDCTLAILWRETPSGIAPPAHPGHAVPEPRLYSSPEVGQDAAGTTH